MSQDTIERKSLESLLDEAPAQPGAAQPQATGVTEPTPEQGKPAAQSQPGKPDDGKGKDGAAPAPSEDELPDDVKGLKATVKNERARRQKKDAEVDDLKKQVAALTAKINSKPAVEDEDDEPDPIIDPKGFRVHQDAKVVQRTVELTRELMIDQVGEEDFVQAERAFIAAAQRDEALAREMALSANPARFAYRHGKKLLEDQAASPSSEDAMFAKFKSRLEQDYDLVPKQKPAANGQTPPAQQQQPAPAQRPPVRLPTSLASVPSTGPRNVGAKPIARRSMQELLDT